MYKIPFFNYPALYQSRREKYDSILKAALESGYYIMGPELTAFEGGLAEYTTARHAIGVADGTMALICGALASGIQPGDEVLVPAHTFIASASAIHHCGAKPVVVDCGVDHLICPNSARQHITNKTKAIMPVQLNGRTANMDAIRKLSSEYDLIIIEDSCQALGSKFKGKQAGTFGSAGALSFYPSKTLGCFGDGGAVLTNDDEVAEKIRTLRDHGRGSDGEISMYGYNARLDNIHAAILLFKLSFYDEEIEKRRSLARIYNDRLSGIEGLHLPPAPDALSDHFDIFQNYEIESVNRDALRHYLHEKGIGTILQWGGKTLNQYKSLSLSGEATYADGMTDRFMMLPMNTTLLDEDVNRICDEIITFYKNQNC